MKTKDGRLLHILSEIKDGETVMVAYKYYDKRKKVWVRELKPKTEIE